MWLLFGIATLRQRQITPVLRHQQQGTTGECQMQHSLLLVGIQRMFHQVETRLAGRHLGLEVLPSAGHLLMSVQYLEPSDQFAGKSDLALDNPMRGTDFPCMAGSLSSGLPIRTLSSAKKGARSSLAFERWWLPVGQAIRIW